MSVTLPVLGLVVPWLFVGLGCWIGYLLIRQNGRILLRLEAMERHLRQSGAAAIPAPAPAMPRGLPVGSEAPGFELPTLGRERMALSDLRGKRLLLIFFSPRCGFCTQMAPDLAALPADGADGKPMPVVVSTGDAKENRELVKQHGIRCPVLLQEAMEVAAAYQAGGTPTGYLIDEEGRIASAFAVGAQALLDLVDTTNAGVADEAAHGPKGHKGNRSLADSHLQRNGLAAGTPAPDFTLSRLDGGELSLAEYRGRKVLLVFSDPNCGPCNALAPELEEVHRRSGDAQVLLVSRGDVAANRAKSGEHGITFPVVLQRQWEISRQYAMFATPAAYLIDENGTIATEVATGKDAILTLLSSAGERRCRCGKPVSECGCANGTGDCAKNNGSTSRAKQRVR